MTRHAETSRGWNDMPLPAYPADVPRVTILRATIPPQAKLEMHRHAVVNAGVVLRGEAVIEMVNAAHYGEIRGNEEVELVMFYAGAEGLPLSEKP